MNVLVNASAANEGGALTILNSYIRNKLSTDDHYIVLSPKRPHTIANNITWICVSTTGFGTFIFTLFFVTYYYFRFGCEKLVSFNNLNSCFPFVEKVTYFHNLLICNDSALKYKLIRWAIKHLNQKSSTFIFQTSYVRCEFVKVFGFQPRSKICWPGVYNSEYVRGLLSGEVIKNVKMSPHSFVWPASNIEYKHKNFELLCEIAAELPSIQFLVPGHCNSKVNYSNILFLGPMAHDDFLKLLSQSDGVIVTSKIETVCLPIFEAINLHRKAFVFRQPYLDGIFSIFPRLSVIQVFESANDAVLKIKATLYSFSLNDDFEFNIGNWEF